MVSRCMLGGRGESCRLRKVCATAKTSPKPFIKLLRMLPETIAYDARLKFIFAFREVIAAEVPSPKPAWNYQQQKQFKALSRDNAITLLSTTQTFSRSGTFSLQWVNCIEKAARYQNKTSKEASVCVIRVRRTERKFRVLLFYSTRSNRNTCENCRLRPR